MKRSFYLAAALAVATAAFWFCLPHADAQPAPAPAQQSETQQAAAEQQARIERYNQLVREQEDRAKRTESLLNARRN